MITTQRLRLETQADGQVIDLTDEVAKGVAGSAITDGTVTVFVTATTAGVTIMEYEPGLVQDLKQVMERLFPRSAIYQHNIINHDNNGHAHTQATFIGPSLVVPVAGSRPMLGTWQRIVLVDFDSRPRNREVILQIMGE